MYDDLDSLWEELEPRLERRFNLFSPSGMTWDEPVVTWDPEEGLDEFLELAERLGVPMLYVTVTRFTEESLSDLQARLLDQEGPHPGAAAILTRAEGYLDRISSIDIGWMFQGVGHFCEIEATWSIELEDEIAEERELDEMELAAERLLLEEQLRFVPQWAREVAQAVEFSRTRTMHQRMELVSQVIPEIEEITKNHRHGSWIARRLTRDVARKAFRIYETELLPTHERELARQAHELLSQGLRKYAVAARLGISKERLNRLISRYPAEADEPPTTFLAEP